MRPRYALFTSLCLAGLSAAQSFSCNPTVGGKTYDLAPLAGVREVSKESDTPPTKTVARVRMELCAGDGLTKDDGVDERDQCPPGTKVCLTLINKKSDEQDRVTSVIPLWAGDVTDSNVKVGPASGNDGLEITVNANEYAGLAQAFHLKLLCSSDAHDPAPTFDSYSNGNLYLSWSSPDACPRSNTDDPPNTPSGRTGGGFFSFLKMVFWLAFVGLVLYFVLGIAYNHNNYSAKGWDLVPHRDFWREVPTLFSDLTSHLMSGIRGHRGGGGGAGGGGRGGYSSL